MATSAAAQFPLDQDEIDHLLSHFDGEGPEHPDHIAWLCESFDEWIAEQSAAGSRPEAELDRYRAEIWYMRGTIANKNGDLDASLSFLVGSVQRSERVGNVKRQIMGLRSLARSYEYIGMQTESTRCIFDALDLAESLGDDRVLGLVLHGLSALYEAQGAYEQILESANRTREIAERVGDPHLLARAFGALSLSCGFLDRGAEALDWSEKALAVCRANGMSQAARTLSLNKIFLYQKAGRTDDAVRFAEEQLDAIAALPPQHAAALYVDAAEVNIVAGNLVRAEEMLELADQATHDERMKAHLLRYLIVAASLYAAQGNHERALEMMRRHHEYEQEVRGRAAQARLVTVERFFAAELAAKTEELHHLRTVELVNKNNQLSDLVHQKDEILHVVVHDLRNPLAAVQLLGESLVIDLGDKLNDDTLDRLQSIGDAAIEMRSTVDTLLASHESEPSSDATSVSTAVRRAVSDAQERSSTSKISIEAAVDEVDLPVNSALLRRSICDLLWNAIESSERDSIVHISVAPSASQGAQITITGGHRPLSQPWANRKSVYLARRLIERMRGSVDVAPHPDGTSTTIKIHLRP